MKLISKLSYQARKHGLDITVKSDDEVKLMNLTNKKYIHILPNGKVYSDNILGQDRALKELMTEFLIEEFGGSFLTLPVKISLHISRDISREDLVYAKHCLEQCFANIKLFLLVKDEDLLPSEIR